MKLHLPKLLLLAVVAAGFGTAYGTNGWHSDFGGIYYIDHETAQDINANEVDYTTWKIWSDTGAANNQPTNTTINTLTFKDSDTATVELGTWDNSRNFDTITFTDISVANGGSATLNIGSGQKAAIGTVSAGTISSTVNGSLAVTGNAAMNQLTYNGTLTNSGTLTVSNMVFAGKTINNTGGTFTVSDGFTISGLDYTTRDGQYSDGENGRFKGSHTLIEGGTVEISQSVMDSNTSLQWDDESKTLSYQESDYGTTYYVNNTLAEYNGGDISVTHFNVADGTRLTLNSSLDASISKGIKLAGTDSATIKLNGSTVALNHTTQVSTVLGAKVAYEIIGGTLTIDKEGNTTNIKSLYIDGGKATLANWSSNLGSASSYVDMTLTNGGKFTFNAAGNWGGQMYTNINVDGSGTIAGASNGNFAEIHGTVTGHGTLTLSDAYGTNDWTISGVISDDANGVLAVKVDANQYSDIFLSGANTYTGGTKVVSGNLYVNSGSTLGSGDVEVDGGNLYLNGKDAVTSAKLTIKNGMVTATYSGGNDGDTAINKATTVEIGGGGTLKLAGHDALGWDKNYAPKINLKGDSAEKVATLDIQDQKKDDGTWDVFTGVAAIEMQGNSVMTGNRYNTFGGNLTVSGTNNKITLTEFMVRENVEISVTSKEDTLTIDSQLTHHSDTVNFTGTITKTGAGTLTITGTDNTYNRGITVEGGKLVMEGAANHAGMLTMADGTELQTGTGVIKDLVLASGSTLNAAAAVTLGGSLELGTGLTLGGDLYASIMAMTADSEPVLLFRGVNTLTLGAAGDALTIDVLSEEDEKDLCTWFSNVAAGTYYLSYDATSGSVYAGMIATVPEPTTATLSLLALAGLCARRRRK